MDSSATKIPFPSELEGQTSDSAADDLSAKKQERIARVLRRMDQMQEFKRPYEVQMKRSYLLYEGISRMNPDEAPEIKHSDIVQPFAAIFVETKVAEEYSATTDFELVAKDDEDDVWKAELNMECVNHVRRNTFAQARKLDLLRTKNIAGVAIKRKGYRLIMRTLKEPKTEDEFGRMLTYEEVEVPWFDDIFEEEVDPFDFLVDPNATNMNDAMDCGQFHRMNWEDAFEQFGKDKRFNFEGIKPGADNMVEFFEYFCAPRDEWIMLAWSSTGTRYNLDHSRTPAACHEVYYGPLPDKHKMLPYTSQHTLPSFVTGFFTDVIGTSPETGEEAGVNSENIVGHRTFWTPGIPLQIADLIDLRTSFGRQALEALRAAATNIIATEGNYRFNNKKKWKNGEQAVGMKGKAEILNGGQAHVGDFQFTFDDLYTMMVQRVGVDPRNITDSKQKTATEDIAQRESSAKRLNAEIEWNEIIEGTRDGYITYKLIQQHYTRKEMVRLTGNETPEEMKRYDETKGTNPMNGKPLIGLRYRKILTKKPMKSFKAGKKNMLKEDSYGVRSFLSRPEHIQMSEAEVVIIPRRRAGQIRALLKQQASDDMTMWLQFFQLTVPDPITGKPASINVDDLPNFKRLVEKWVIANEGSITKDIGQPKKSVKMAKTDEAKKILTDRTPFNAIPKNAPPTSPAGAAPVPSALPIPTQ